MGDKRESEPDAGLDFHLKVLQPVKVLHLKHSEVCYLCTPSLGGVQMALNEYIEIRKMQGATRWSSRVPFLLIVRVLRDQIYTT